MVRYLGEVSARFRRFSGHVGSAIVGDLQLCWILQLKSHSVIMEEATDGCKRLPRHGKIQKDQDSGISPYGRISASVCSEDRSFSCPVLELGNDLLRTVASLVSGRAELSRLSAGPMEEAKPIPG